MECTRGDHAKPDGWTRAGEEQRLAEALAAAFERDACVLIPVFALGKTQEILAMLYKFRRQRLLPNFRFILAVSARNSQTSMIAARTRPGGNCRA